MDYQGVIIEESLKDAAALKLVDRASTKVEPVTEVHKTPWLKQWTLHTITMPAGRVDEMAKRLSHELETNHTAWYIDFKNDAIHYIIFPDNVFRIDRTKADEYQAATNYGLSLGIPDYQLDFSPHIVHRQRPAKSRTVRRHYKNKSSVHHTRYAAGGPANLKGPG